MTTIYIVTTGDYSNYAIQGVCDSKDRAELLAKAFKGCTPEIEEWELNEHIEELQLGFKPYEVSFMSDGTITATSGERWDTRLEYSTPPGGYTFSIVAKDEEHAIKIATDMRAKELAEKEGLIP